jgi:hypothetical protein
MYDEFYNQDGKKCYIKISRKFLTHELEIVGRVLIRFKSKNDIEWMYHTPVHKFVTLTEVMNFIIINLENDDMQFKISPTADSIIAY